MIIEGNKGISICTLFNNKLLTLNESENWSIWLKKVRDLSDNTIKTFMKSMERFWLWSLYNPVTFDESFPSYQARYREALRYGFIIEEIISNEQDLEDITLCISSSKPMQKVTINKEIAGINSYFYYTEEHDLLYDHRFINYLYEKQRSARSFLSGIQIKKSNLALEAFGKHKAYMPPYKISKNRKRTKYLPLIFFDELLEIAKPRERLIYLLCGACSSRIGQALNMTLYDIDYDKEEIWLVNPKVDDEDLYGKKRRQWLKSEYNIDMSKKNSHNTSDLQFKYPIPLYREALYWLNEEKYKKIFFDTLQEYVNSAEYMPESARYPRHPFLFTTKTGKRVHARETLSRFKSSLLKISIKHNLGSKLSSLGLHSLRHMFGHAMAEIYARYPDDSIITTTQHAMGHSNLESTMTYFSVSSETMRATMKRLTKNIYNQEKEYSKCQEKEKQKTII